MTVAYVLDTGALIAAERGDARVLKLFGLATMGRTILRVPMVCILEWWRGRTDVRETILRAVVVEPLTLAITKAAGEAIARVAGASAIDSAVMATAAVRGGIVITQDVGDLEKLRTHFPSVRVLRRGDIPR